MAPIRPYREVVMKSAWLAAAAFAAIAAANIAASTPLPHSHDRSQIKVEPAPIFLDTDLG
jgi:hypothetical protein